jgi:phosphopantothenoylcysteine synthetase/decarboxylase
MSANKKNILVLMSGSIAAFKAVTMISSLKKKNYEIKVAVTANTLNFIGKSTFTGLLGDNFYFNEWESSQMEHIDLERWADLIVFCPVTANRLNMMRTGIASDLVANIWLAHDFKKKFLLFPAMNKAMWNHPTTKESVKFLKEQNLKVFEPDSGILACGEEGEGRLLEPEIMVKIIEDELQNKI